MQTCFVLGTPTSAEKKKRGRKGRRGRKEGGRERVRRARFTDF